MAYGWGWRPYVPVRQRQQNAAKHMNKLRKKGLIIQPVTLEGRTIARTFWGKAWCEHLESFSDYENRLPRGRTYVRNGSVCHLEIHEGKIAAKVSGSSLYEVKVSIKTLPDAKWGRIQTACAGRVGSMLELLQGRLSSQVMSVVTDRKDGLFPLTEEIDFDCSCPDWAGMCKHIAAVLYGVGARLDNSPELLFLLRGVDHNQLISADAAKVVVATGKIDKGRMLEKESVEAVFGIELDEARPAKVPKLAKAAATVRPAKPRTKPATAGRSGAGKLKGKAKSKAQ